MYCVKCGVELSESEKKCPLCMTPVYFPELPENSERPYPEFTKARDEISKRGIYFIISMLYLIALIIPLVCDISLNSSLVWSGFVTGGIVLSYIIVILPQWFRYPSPAVFVPIDFVAILSFVFYVNIAVDGDWFLSFALPVISAVALIVSAVTILIYYLRCAYLYIFGGAFISGAFFSIFLEYMLHFNFGIHDKLYWSIYPFIALFLIGVMLIVIAIVKPFRESLRKIFAI